MVKVVEVRGFLFSTTLSDGSTLFLQPGEEATIKDSLVSESLNLAYKKGIVSLRSVESTKQSTTKDKTGGVNK